MFPEKGKSGDTGRQQKGDKKGPPEKEPSKEKPFLKMLKKVGFSIWITVMIIGGALAFFTSLLLL